jgi:hypothetical protein
MNLQERTVLESFLDQLVQVHRVDKIPQADALIKRAVEQQPDAAYLLVQRALLLGQALDQAKARIAELERTQDGTSRGFLDSGASSWSASMPQASTATAAPGRPLAGVGGPSSQFSGPLSAGPAGSSVPSNPGAGSSFLGQAAATAAGVAGGAFLFEGVESLLGHHGSSIPDQEAAATFPQEDVTNNNYYASNDRSTDAGDSPPESDDPDEQEESDTDFGSDGGDFV